MNIGILNIQGDVSEHYDFIKKLGKKYGVSPLLVKNNNDLNNVSGLIIPGGESTVIYNILVKNNMYDNIINLNKNGLYIMGTCAGAIILSEDTSDIRVKGMGLIDIKIKRNAYGRQINSFIENIYIKHIGNFSAVFIRAPEIEEYKNSELLSEYNNKPVFVRNKNVFALTFHPELTEDPSIHEYFIKNILEDETGSNHAQQ